MSSLYSDSVNSEQSLGGFMFPVSNLERNVHRLSEIWIASSVRSAGFGDHNMESLVSSQQQRKKCPYNIRYLNSVFS